MLTLHSVSSSQWLRQHSKLLSRLRAPCYDSTVVLVLSGHSIHWAWHPDLYMVLPWGPPSPSSKNAVHPIKGSILTHGTPSRSTQGITVVHRMWPITILWSSQHVNQKSDPFSSMTPFASFLATDELYIVQAASTCNQFLILDSLWDMKHLTAKEVNSLLTTLSGLFETPSKIWASSLLPISSRVVRTRTPPPSSASI